jgi:TolB-like protein
MTMSLLLFSAVGCTTVSVDETYQKLVPVNSIGILPAQVAEITILPSDTKTREQLEAGADIITSLLTDYFKNSQKIEMISASQLEGLTSSVEAAKLLNIARDAGQQLHYDAVLITSVKRYQARKGANYSVVRPASVYFSLQLLAVASGQILWSADFDQTQKTLFENILPSTRSTGSGFRWLTAAELASAGLTKKLNSCPYL